jgi:hypothetical protein
MLSSGHARRIIENSTRRDIVVSSHDVRAAAIRERDRLRAEARASA